MALLLPVEWQIRDACFSAVSARWSCRNANSLPCLNGHVAHIFSQTWQPLTLFHPSNPAFRVAASKIWIGGWFGCVLLFHHLNGFKQWNPFISKEKFSVKQFFNPGQFVNNCRRGAL